MLRCGRYNGNSLESIECIQVTKTVQINEKMLAMNEALVLGSVRQQELTEAAETLNVQLQKEIAERKLAEAALKESEDRYRNLFNSMDEGYCIIEMMFDKYQKPVDYRFLEVNRAFEKQSGMYDVTGKRMLEFVGEIEEQWLGNYGKVALTGEPVRFANEYKSLDRWFDVYAFKFGEPESRRVAILFTDISARKRSEKALSESDDRFRAIAENIPQLAWMIDGDGNVNWFNRGWLEYTGTTLEENVGVGWKTVHHPDYVDAVAEKFERHLREGRDWEDTFPLRGKDGDYRWFLSRMNVIRDQSGKVMRFFGTNTDITNERMAEDRQRLLTNELAHRGKNLLAVIQSIASRSLSGTRSLAEARDVLVNRIQALAQSQSALLNEGFEGAPIAEIIRLEFRAFSERVKADGPTLMLNSRVAQTFALVMHELATNAVKYGALSLPDGHVAIHWSIEGLGVEARFKFRWQERNGPPVSPPDRQGFGSIILEKAAAQDFGAPPVIRFAPEGLSYEIDAPLKVVVVAVSDVSGEGGGR